MALVASSSHMRGFIAGAATIGPVNASAVAVRTLAASPWAIRDMVVAESGAMQRSSATVEASRCGNTSSPPSVSTGRRESAAKVVGPTNRRESGVCTTCTSWPSLTSSRTSSQLLYAAMPPHTPTRIMLVVWQIRGGTQGSPAGRHVNRSAMGSGPVRGQPRMCPPTCPSGVRPRIGDRNADVTVALQTTVGREPACGRLVTHA